jgi:hypothetical protein
VTVINDIGDNPKLAFPLAVGDVSQYQHIDAGMTLRDYFAAQAIGAIASDYLRATGNMHPEHAAAAAYEIADAMLAEREKKK